MVWLVSLEEKKMNKQQVIELVRNSLIEAIRTTGNRGFSLSQSKCPVVTGALKASGKNEDIDNGTQIQYTKDYSSFVERGREPGTINVGAYKRKDGIRVKAYSYFSKGSVARHFIKNGLTDAFESDFGNNFDNELHKVFHKVAKV